MICARILIRATSSAALALLVACSSSAKQADESSRHTDSASRDGAPAASSTPGSAADPWAAKPRDPAADSALLRADIDVMCGAAKATGGKTFGELGPYIAEHMKSAFRLELFADFRTRTLDELIDRMRVGMVRANVNHCDTVDVLVANDPRKKQ